MFPFYESGRCIFFARNGNHPRSRSVGCKKAAYRHNQPIPLSIHEGPTS